MLRDLITTKWVYVLVAVACAVAVFVLSATENPASSFLFSKSQESQPKPAEKIVKTAQEIRASKTPVNPEGKMCYAFFDYLDANSKQNLEGKSLKDIKESTHSLQEPVEKELKSVKDKDFADSFHTYVKHNDDYVNSIIKTGEGDTSVIEADLERMSQLCSTPVATEAVAK